MLTLAHASVKASAEARASKAREAKLASDALARAESLRAACGLGDTGRRGRGGGMGRLGIDGWTSSFSAGLLGEGNSLGLGGVGKDGGQIGHENGGYVGASIRDSSDPSEGKAWLPGPMRWVYATAIMTDSETGLQYYSTGFVPSVYLSLVDSTPVRGGGGGGGGGVNRK